MLNLALGLVIGFLLGMAWQLRRQLRQAREVRRRLAELGELAKSIRQGPTLDELAKAFGGKRDE